MIDRGKLPPLSPGTVFIVDDSFRTVLCRLCNREGSLPDPRTDRHGWQDAMDAFQKAHWSCPAPASWGKRLGRP